MNPKTERSRILSSGVVSLGPGLVYVLTSLGSGDIVSNGTAGASYGYQLIWVLAMTLMFRFVWVNASAKYVLVSGESLFTGYGRLGHWVVWMILISIIPIRHLYNLFLILINGSSAHLLFPLPTEWSASIWSGILVLVGFAMMFWGGYPMVERFCRALMAIMGVSLLIAAALSSPDPRAILEGMFLPRLPQAEGLYSALFIMMALIGAEAGSTANLTYPYFVFEKGWRDVSYLKQQRFDLGFGILCMFIMGSLLQIAAAGTIHPLGVQVEGADDLARVFSETQGKLGLIVFGLGLWGATFSSYVGANMGSALIITDICRTFVPGLKIPAAERNDPKLTKKDPVYRWAIVFWVFSPTYIIFTGVSPIWLVLAVSAFTIVLIPMLAICLLLITNKKEIMGRYRNGLFTNSVMIILILIALYFTYINFRDLLG